MTGKESDALYLVTLSNYDEHGGAAYSTREAAEQAKNWFEENTEDGTAVMIREMPLRDEFASPESFHPGMWAWGY